MNQDFVGWVGQGVMSDRWNEHLGESDRGVIMIRKRFMDDLEVLEDGGDPKAINRSELDGRRLHLPIIDGGVRTAGETPSPFPFLTGQPQAIIDEMSAVWAKYAQAGDPREADL